MTDAPEKIWVCIGMPGWLDDGPAEGVYDTEYTRTDISQARIAELEAVLAIAESAMHEHDTACYEYGEENPWTMGEWFDVSDREAIAKARSSVPPENAALKAKP
jgi:hypothetical protein